MSHLTPSAKVLSPPLPVASAAVGHQRHIALCHQPLFSPGARECLVSINIREHVHRPCGCAFDDCNCSLATSKADQLRLNL